jgi:2'-5' RNA ligase superfamily
VAAEEHETAVVVPVPDAEPVVSAWRDQFDSSAAQGMPAHVTALYPFLPAERLETQALTRLRRLCAERPVLKVEFRRTARFPGVLYLEPEPSDGLRS